MPVRHTPGHWMGFAAIAASSMAGCVGSDAGASAARQFPLANLTSATISVTAVTQSATRSADKREIRVWLADDADEQTEGLMFVSAAEIADDQGMLFVFDDERIRGFWMKNTITPLDIAYARADGTIVAIHAMPALTLETFSSYEPAMFALEMKAGSFQRLDVREGDRLVIPDDVFR
jgi:uncharacterized membrane protein (UPF0127 family)